LLSTNHAKPSRIVAYLRKPHICNNNYFWNNLISDKSYFFRLAFFAVLVVVVVVVIIIIIIIIIIWKKTETVPFLNDTTPWKHTVGVEVKFYAFVTSVINGV
jgi:amino acid transporter